MIPNSIIVTLHDPNDIIITSPITIGVANLLCWALAFVFQLEQLYERQVSTSEMDHFY